VILHTCPHCNGSSFYPEVLRGQTNCRSCGQPFELSQLTRAHPNSFVSAFLTIQRAARKARSAPATIYAAASVATLFVVWIVLSVFGFIPDEIRFANRRFVSLDNWERAKQAVGLVAVGIPNERGDIAFLSYGTAWAICNDGFMLTNKHIVLLATKPPETPLGEVRTWVYVDKQRINADVVWADVVADIAVLKVDDYLPYRFRVGGKNTIQHLNVEVAAVGFQEMPTKVESTVMDTELASTKGTVSRVYQDAVGTAWIEHTAPLKGGSSGGPLILDGRVIGINTTGEHGIYQALDLGPYRDKVFEVVKEWRDRQD